MQRVASAGANIIDVVAYPFVTDFDAILAKNPVGTWGKYVNRLKLGGGKITLDGSPQGKTAFFTTPYLTGGPGGEKHWRGEPSFPEDFVKAFVKKVYDLGLPLNAHANGDAAIVIVDENSVAADLVNEVVFQRAIFRAVEKNCSAATDGPVRAQERLLRVHDGAGRLAESQATQCDPLDRMRLVAAKFNQRP